MKPQKSDFIGVVNLPDVIEDQEVNIYVTDAFKFDIKPKLQTLGTDILAYDSSTGTKPQLKTFYDDHILEWWVRLAYKRFIEFHGRNVTQFGMTKTKDPGGTFDQVDQIERSVMLKQIKGDADVLYQYVLQQTWTFDNVAYRKPCKPDKGSFGINAIG
jgi:hypothetical protein